MLVHVDRQGFIIGCVQRVPTLVSRPKAFMKHNNSLRHLLGKRQDKIGEIGVVILILW